MKLFQNLKKELDKKTNPNEPIIRGKAVEMFFLRLLLVVFCYVVINSLIIRMPIWKFILIDMLLYSCEGLVKWVRKQK